MPKNKTKAAIIAGVAVCLMFGAIVLFVKHEHSVHFQRLQGAWEGAMHFHRGRLMCIQRVVLRISMENNSYRAAVDLVDLGYRNLPVSRFDFGSSVVNFKLTNGISYHGEVDGNTMELRGRWTWPGTHYSQPLALARTDKPDAVPSPLAEADCTQRPGSNLQGRWTGTVGMEKPLRLELKIAEAADGSFRAEVSNLDQPHAIPWPVTSLTYRQPYVKFELQGIGMMFEGELNESCSRIAGTMIVAKPYGMTFERVNPKEAQPTNSLAFAERK